MGNDSLKQSAHRQVADPGETGYESRCASNLSRGRKRAKPVVITHNPNNKPI